MILHLIVLFQFVAVVLVVLCHCLAPGPDLIAVVKIFRLIPTFGISWAAIVNGPVENMTVMSLLCPILHCHAMDNDDGAGAIAKYVIVHHTRLRQQ